MYVASEVVIVEWKIVGVWQKEKEVAYLSFREISVFVRTDGRTGKRTWLVIGKIYILYRDEKSSSTSIKGYTSREVG